MMIIHKKNLVQKGTYCKTIRIVYDKPTTSIILNGRKLEAVPLRSRSRPECSFSPLLFDVVFRNFSQCHQARKRNHKDTNWTERCQIIPVCRWHDHLYTEIKDSTGRLLEFIREFSKTTGYKINTQKSVTFLYTYNVLADISLTRPVQFTITTKTFKGLEINLSKTVEDLYNKKITKY